MLRRMDNAAGEVKLKNVFFSLHCPLEFIFTGKNLLSMAVFLLLLFCANLFLVLNLQTFPEDVTHIKPADQG